MPIGTVPFKSAPKFRYLPARANVVADTLLRNSPLGAITDPTPVPSFTLHELGIAQQKHDVWAKVIYALEKGNETSLPRLPVPF